MFVRAFRVATHDTPHAYVRRCRLDQAEYLLRTTSLPVEAVARRCGFASRAHLSAATRVTRNTTPARLRDAARSR